MVKRAPSVESSPSTGDRAAKAPSISIEATWAPRDPRDRLYDPGASSVEKVGSLFRIVGAFHPVLNLIILAYDSIRKLGAARAVFLGLILIAVFFALHLWFWR